MPFKFSLKPRNVRSVIFVMILFTLLFAIYHIIFGLRSEPSRVDVVYSLDSEASNTNFRKHEDDTWNLVSDIHNQNPKQKPSKSVHHSGTFASLIPRYGQYENATSKYEHERQPGRCPKIQIVRPDMDVNELYPTFEFDGDWIRTKEYWNPMFEKRYQDVRKSPKTPPLKVFVIPHSHTDPGWLKTFEEYYNSDTRNILDNAVIKLTEHKKMTFQCSEIAFLSKWWDEAHPRKREMLRTLVKEGRFEIVTGGWTMTDEAVVNLYSMIDQLIEGHQWVKANLGVTPTTSWSVDPFGHGATFPFVLKQAGITGMIIQRIHYVWKKFFMVNRTSDFEWVQRWDAGNKFGIRCHNMPFDIYSIKHSCGPHPHVCLNFDFRSLPGQYGENSMIMQPITDENVQDKAELMIEQYRKTGSLFPHNMALISMGDDFRFSHQIEWDQQYSNYTKLFDYINKHKERYNVDIKFATISEYFKALHDFGYHFPTLSGDFHVYSDIFSNGRPAYWSGYYGTRPFWKKFYREVGSSLRGAEILYTFSHILSSQKNLAHSQEFLGRLYEKLVTARRWLALFSHHDASTGTSKAHTMLDYGHKLQEAYHNSQQVQMAAIQTILYGKADRDNLSTTIEIDGFGTQPRQVPIILDASMPVQRLVVYNSLARHRYQVVTVVVNTPDVEVLGPNGEIVQAQINPIVDTSGNKGKVELSSDIFELSFLVSLPPLSISIFQVKQGLPQGKRNAEKAIIYCRGCKNHKGMFNVEEIQGDIQLNNDKTSVLFDRNTGLLLSIKKLQENVTVGVDMKFGSYYSVYFQSGAYLLKPEVDSSQAFPPSSSLPSLIIASGPVSSELSVFHESVLTVSSKLMHVGDPKMQEALYIQNNIDVGETNGEVYMRFDTDLKSVAKVAGAKNEGNKANENDGDSTHPSHQPMFYTDQAGFTVEKRVKVPHINYEGNTYPVNTMAYLQDDARKLRFSVLVDRAHGFSSMETGRLESLVERRTAYDDGRGMGEGVTDNRMTTSNYILLLEKLGPLDKFRHEGSDYRNSQPTLAGHHHSQELSLPASVYFINEPSSTISSQGSNDCIIFTILNQELPCDSNLINLRTVTDSSFASDTNFPSSQALLVVQKLGYLCNSLDEKPGCGNPNPSSLFYPDTKFNGIKLRKIEPSSLTGHVTSTGSMASLHKIVADPFEIKSFVISFT